MSIDPRLVHLKFTSEQLTILEECYVKPEWWRIHGVKILFRTEEFLNTFKDIMNDVTTRQIKWVLRHNLYPTRDRINTFKFEKIQRDQINFNKHVLLQSKAELKSQLEEFTNMVQILAQDPVCSPYIINEFTGQSRILTFIGMCFDGQFHKDRIPINANGEPFGAVAPWLKNSGNSELSRMNDYISHYLSCDDWLATVLRKDISGMYQSGKKAERNGNKVIEWIRTRGCECKRALVEYKVNPDIAEAFPCSFRLENLNQSKLTNDQSLRMVLHHMNPEEKEGSISDLIFNSRKLEAELVKCVVLRESCHRIIHAMVIGNWGKSESLASDITPLTPPSIEMVYEAHKAKEGHFTCPVEGCYVVTARKGDICVHIKTKHSLKQELLLKLVGHAPRGVNQYTKYDESM